MADMYKRGCIAAASMEHKGKKHSPHKAILAGGLSGAIEICITFPTEYVKTQLHLQHETADHHHVKKFRGPWHVVQSTVHDHGVKGLYRGIAPLLYFSIPKVASRFWAYESLRNALADENNKLSTFSTLLCGLGAGTAEAIIAVAPMETVKVKFIHDQVSGSPQFRNFFHGVGMIVREKGLGGLYQGVFATVLKQASNQAIRFSVYNPLKEYFQGDDPTKDIGVLRTMACGAIAGAASVFGNTPIDVIKSRMQTTEWEEILWWVCSIAEDMQSLDAHAKYRNSLHCAQLAWAEGGGTLRGGLKIFYKGTTPRLSRVCADVALTFALYEQIMKMLDLVWETKQ